MDRSMILAIVALAVWLPACNDTGFSGSAKKDKPAAVTRPKAEETHEKDAVPKIEKPDDPPAEEDEDPPPKTKKTAPKDDGTPKPPRDGCQAFVTGRILSNIVDTDISRVFTLDDASEWVGAGRYPSNPVAFPKANRFTFDGIALDKGTRLVIYSQPNFKGSVIFDGRGPLVLNNSKQKAKFPQFFTTVNKTWDAPLQAKFPPSTRKLSDSDMNAWGLTGSTVITCE